jgi:hypothetical protein
MSMDSIMSTAVAHELHTKLKREGDSKDPGKNKPFFHTNLA